MDQCLSDINIFRRNSYFSIDSAIFWAFGFIYTMIFIRDAESSSFSTVRATIGLKAKLFCSTDITGAIHVHWSDPSGTTLTYDGTVETGDSRFKIDRTYLKEWNLEIDNVRRTDAGNYTCSIGPTPVVQNVVQLVIVVAPSLVTPPANVVSAVGNQVKLSCEASGEPQPTITWTHISPNSGPRLDLKVTGPELNISAVTVEDAGIYECQANNNVPPAAFGRTRLEILFGPQITVLFRDISQEEGGSTLLTCLVRANPAENLFWERNGTAILHSNRYQIQNWETGEYQTTLGLFIIGLVDSDFGDYKCKAVNEHGKAEGKITINEYRTGRVRVIATPKDTLARVNDGVFFECSALSLDHGNYLIWRRILPGSSVQTIFISHLSKTPSSRRNINETFRFDNSKYEIRGHYGLYIKQVSFSDAGTYVCDVSGQQNNSAELTVVDERVSCGSTRTDVSEGDAVTLVCSLAYRGLSPNWRVTWMHEERPVASTTEDSDGLIKRTLQFNASHPLNTGKYQCAVTVSEFQYSSSCRVDLNLNVLSSKIGGFIIPRNQCEIRNGTSEYCSYISSTLIIIILSSILAAIFILSVVIICCLVTFHKQEMAKFKEPCPKLKSTRNGSVDLEMTPLTCSSPSPQPPA